MNITYRLFNSRIFRRAVTAGSLSLILAVGIIAQVPGSLDTTFDVDGKAITTFVSRDIGSGSVLQPDGKLVVAGQVYGRQPGLAFGVMRMNPDGSLDSTFDGDGKTIIGINSISRGYVVALQPDGKIVVAGSATSQGSEYWAVARLNANGSLDTSFNGTGTRVLEQGYDDHVRTVLIQGDGKILLIGTGYFNTKDITAIRLNTDGTSDSSFGTGGVVYTQVTPGNGYDFGYAGALQTDGKIVVVGSSTIGNNSQTSVVRYNTDGSLDSSFDGDGKLGITFTEPLSASYAVAIQPDGKIAIGGTSSDYGGANAAFTVIRLNTDGSLDTSFDTDGKVRTPIGTGVATINAIGLTSDGKILAAGISNSPLNIGDRDATFARYNSDGSLDTSFDGDGILVRGSSTSEDAAAALLILDNGKVFVSGYRAANGDGFYEYSVMKLNPDGSADTGFSSDGTVSFWLGLDDFINEEILAVCIQADGKIVAVGTANDDFAVARYLSNGSLDPTFDGDGRLMLSPLTNANNQGSNAANDVAVQPDGKIVVVGGVHDTSTGNRDIVVARFMPDGSPDPTFDSDGKVITRVGTAMDDARSVKILSDGKILIAGETAPTSSKINFLLARYNSNGSLDTTFSDDGLAITAIRTRRDAAYDVAVQADGKYVAVGFSTDSSNFPQSAVVRYNTDGSIDTGFGTDGIVIGYGPSNSNSVAITPAGRIVVGGTHAGTFSASRLNANGSIDESFGEGGMAVTTIGISAEARSMVMQGDGKIVLAGSSKSAQIGYFNTTLVRYTASGTLDTSFDGDGIAIVPVTARENRAYGVALQTDGKIVTGGTSFTEEYKNDFTLARFHSGYAPPAGSTPFDFDGDGKTDIGIFRPSGGEWWVNRSGDGQTFALQFGSSTDVIVPADYTGDGKADVAVFRPSSGEWYVLRSDDFSFFALPFGTNGDVPVPADYDADGKADFAVFRPSSSTWFISQSSGAPTRIVQFGSTGDAPVVSDYDGDGKSDIGIFRQAASGAEWWIDRSTAGLLAMQFGASTDKAVQGDYTGDGKTDIAIWRPSSGEWFIVRSEDFSFYGFPFGTTGDVVAPGDYDGDGKFDVTVFRPSSATWFISRTTAGTQIVQFGATGDRPLPNAFVP